MYAIMLARAFTGRELVFKAGGGWHGAQPFGLKGVYYRDGYLNVEGEGISAAAVETFVTRYNDPEMLHDQFQQFGDRIACLIVEPILGAGGTIPASREYLEAARQLTERHGALLILDEVISGFRFRAGDAGALYGIKPDLATFGKIIGGGMPVAAVAGRADVLALVGRANGGRVKFSGGTYSAHPSSLLAAKTLMSYLADHQDEVYLRLARLGAKMRHCFEDGFNQEGILARTTGGGDNGVLYGSLSMVHFPHRDDVALDKPDVVFDPSICDVTLVTQVLELAFLLENVQIIKGHGAISTAHTEKDLEILYQACRQVARRIKKSAR
jgi:glutamate-1-semialdehyde 2,1-aminomutase